MTVLVARALPVGRSVKLRLIERDGSVEWVDFDFDDGDMFPESILVKRPFFAVLGSRYRLESVPLRSYRYMADEVLPPRRA